MEIGADKSTRAAQRRVLKTLYNDYNPVRHDVFVIRYNQEQDRRALQRFLRGRGVLVLDDPKTLP